MRIKSLEKYSIGFLIDSSKRTFACRQVFSSNTRRNLSLSLLFLFSFFSHGISKRSETVVKINKISCSLFLFISRRAHLKDCFDHLKAEVPCQRDRKITNLQVLNLAIKYIQV